MIKFMLKFLLLLFTMFFGVIVGIQQANTGIQQMRGYHTEETEDAFQIVYKDGKEMEASILGHEVTGHDLEKRKQQLEQIEAFNVFSELGKGLAHIVQKGVSALLAGVKKLVETVWN